MNAVDQPGGAVGTAASSTPAAPAAGDALPGATDPSAPHVILDKP